MPKQRKYDFKRLQGSSSSKIESDEDGSASSVNERLNELRRADYATAAKKKQEMASTVNQPSVPPTLRSILGVPETAPPRARQGTRIARTRTPGPAPPSSWLIGNQSGTATSRSKRVRSKGTVDRKQPEHLFRFGKLCGIVDTVDSTTLSHNCLKQLAANWELLDEEDYPSLAALPPSVRSRLLSYLSFYGPTISLQAFRALIGDGTSMILDLAGLVGNNDLTLSKLTNHIKTSTRVMHESSVMESWEDEDHEQLNIATMSRPFTTLTHLCLSHPPATVLWQDLLNLTKQTPTLTHLSLAYWPRPTLTPNLATTTVQTRFGADIAAGGSHFYSDFDQDFDEPRVLLKQLSQNLLRLQWLDIDGNQSWLLAFIEHGNKIAGQWLDATVLDESSSMQSSDRLEQEVWDRLFPPEARVSNELVTTWQNLTYIRCANSYVPEPLRGLQRSRQMTSLPAVPNIVAFENDAELETRFMVDPLEHQHLLWYRAARKVVNAANVINHFRKAHKCSPIAFDLGWN